MGNVGQEFGVEHGHFPAAADHLDGVQQLGVVAQRVGGERWRNHFDQGSDVGLFLRSVDLRKGFWTNEVDTLQHRRLPHGWRDGVGRSILSRRAGSPGVLARGQVVVTRVLHMSEPTFMKLTQHRDDIAFVACDGFCGPPAGDFATPEPTPDKAGRQMIQLGRFRDGDELRGEIFGKLVLALAYGHGPLPSGSCTAIARW